MVDYDKNNPRILLLKKSNTNIGYVATEINSKDSPSFRIMLNWQQFIPGESDMFSKIAINYNFINEGISFTIPEN